MNSDEFSSFFASFLEFRIDKISTITLTESMNNCLKVVLAVVVNVVVLYLRRCSETAKLREFTITNCALAVVTNNRHRETIESTRAGQSGGQIEDNRLAVKFSVAVREVKHL